MHEIDSLIDGSRASSAVTSDDLPAPEGAAMTNRLPGVAISATGVCMDELEANDLGTDGLFEILHLLLAHWKKHI